MIILLFRQHLYVFILFIVILVFTIFYLNRKLQLIYQAQASHQYFLHIWHSKVLKRDNEKITTSYVQDPINMPLRTIYLILKQRNYANGWFESVFVYTLI